MNDKVEIVDFELGKIIITSKTDSKKVDDVLRKRKDKIELTKNITKATENIPNKL